MLDLGPDFCTQLSPASAKYATRVIICPNEHLFDSPPKTDGKWTIRIMLEGEPYIESRQFSNTNEVLTAYSTLCEKLTPIMPRRTADADMENCGGGGGAYANQTSAPLKQFSIVNTILGADDHLKAATTGRNPIIEQRWRSYLLAAAETDLIFGMASNNQDMIRTGTNLITMFSDPNGWAWVAAMIWGNVFPVPIPPPPADLGTYLHSLPARMAADPTLNPNPQGWVQKKDVEAEINKDKPKDAVPGPTMGDVVQAPPLAETLARYNARQLEQLKKRQEVPEPTHDTGNPVG